VEAESFLIEVVHYVREESSDQELLIVEEVLQTEGEVFLWEGLYIKAELRDYVLCLEIVEVALEVDVFVERALGGSLV
jgi:hypothetical protein